MSAPTRRRFVVSLPVPGAAALVACRKQRTVRKRSGEGGEAAAKAATVYRAVNGGPGDNLEKVLALAGGAGGSSTGWACRSPGHPFPPEMCRPEGLPGAPGRRSGRPAAAFPCSIPWPLEGAE